MVTILLFILIEPLVKLHCNIISELLLLVVGEKSIDILVSLMWYIIMQLKALW